MIYKIIKIGTWRIFFQTFLFTLTGPSKYIRCNKFLVDVLAATNSEADDILQLSKLK